METSVKPNRGKQQQPTHTKGPWKWMRGAESGWRLHGVGTDGKPTLVLRTFPRQGNVAIFPTGYDADLIAAAPELLAALNGLLNCFNSNGEIEETAQDQLSVALEKAELAQAKAEGR